MHRRILGFFFVCGLVLACAPTKAGSPAAPDRLSQADSDALARVVLEEERACAPARQRRMEVLKVMEERYQFSVERGDQLDERFLMIRRAPPKAK